LIERKTRQTGVNSDADLERVWHVATATSYTSPSSDCVQVLLFS